MFPYRQACYCSCSLCGFGAGLSGWMTTVRALQKVSDKYRLTAAGTYQPESDGSKVKLLADENELEPQLLTFDMILSNDDLTTFIIHEACWKILKVYFYNAPVSLNQLGDLLQWWPEKSFRMCYRHSGDRAPGISLSEKEDPSAPINVFTNNLGPLDDLPQPSGAVARWRREKLRTIGNGDCFARLPLEMREMIAAYMPILDFYRLRLVSRAMGELFFSKKGFWKARFEIDSERDFMAVPKTLLHAKKGSRRDWRLIYHLTNVHHIPHGWGSRRKLWERCRWFRDFIMKSSLSNTLGVGSEDLNVSDWDWKGVQAQNLDDDEKSVKQTAFIPSALSSISISFIKEIMGKNTNDYSPPTRQNKFARGDEYVTGIELMPDTDDQPPIWLGHMIPGNRVTYQVKSFKGFEVAMNDKGIHALRIILDADEPATLWIGNSSAASITNRLVLKENVATLEACFTKHRMVSLSLGAKRPVSPAEKGQQTQIQWTDHLMQNALWFPETPPEGLHFSDASSYGINPLDPTYRPFMWTLFGNKDGSRLSSLTGIDVGTTWANACYALFFYYNNESMSNSSLDLGGGWYDKEYFEIDGPGGERIQSVQAVVEDANPNIPVWYRISTNREDCVWTGSKGGNNLPYDYSLKDLDIAPGTTPVGFYATKVNHNPGNPGGNNTGTVVLGVISAAVK